MMGETALETQMEEACLWGEAGDILYITVEVWAVLESDGPCDDRNGRLLLMPVGLCSITLLHRGALC